MLRRSCEYLQRARFPAGDYCLAFAPGASGWKDSILKRLVLPFLLIGSVCCFSADRPAHRLVVVSVDGLDYRYLRDRDQLGLRIPVLRKLLKEGQVASGVVGVFPTITWPSHTTLITGVRPDQHGIEGNRRPRSDGGDYYWTSTLLKAPTLWQAAHERGWTTATVTWPVTVDGAISYNLPEFFQRRNGGSMDLESISSKATPGLIEGITRSFPSFPQQWMDDRTRTLAVLYLLQQKQPDLLLVHLVDLDSEEHDCGPFEANANAILERTDELIGQIVQSLPKEYVLALVSDHGFERLDRIANLPVLLARHGMQGKVTSMGGVAAASDQQTAEFIRQAAKDPSNGIGREIPNEELLRYAPRLGAMSAVFEPADHVMFGPASVEPYFTKPPEKGEHGFWPLRHDYRSVFVLWGASISAESLPEIQMTSIAERLGMVLGIQFPPSP